MVALELKCMTASNLCGHASPTWTYGGKHSNISYSCTHRCSVRDFPFVNPLRFLSVAYFMLIACLSNGKPSVVESSTFCFSWFFFHSAGSLQLHGLCVQSDHVWILWGCSCGALGSTLLVLWDPFGLTYPESNSKGRYTCTEIATRSRILHM